MNITNSIALGTKNGRTPVWTEKYRPVRIEDLVGNTDKIEEIETWFEAYKRKDPNIKRALLFSGPPGLGKTTLAHAILLKHGFKIKEYNASDVRSKKLVHKNLYHIINVGYVDKQSEDFKSLGIIMDEVDGMSSGDMGGMAELISFINPTRGKRSVKKEEKTALSKRWIPPIICICNDNTDKKMKDLKKDCQEIIFKKPTKKELKTIIDRVSTIENFRVNEEAADLICGQAQGDYRRLLTILQNLVTIAKQIEGEGESDPILIDVDLVVSQNSIFCSKDLDLHLSEKVNGIFNNTSKPEQLLKIYETEKSLLPMMMHENYLDFIPLQIGISDFDKLGSIRETIDSIVLGDIIDKTMYNNQSWHLQEIHGLTSSWVPCFYVNRNKKSAYKKVSFTTALGRFSFQRANQKNINGLVRKINKEDTYSLEDVRALSEIILYNLLEPSGNQELGIEYLVEYNLNINDVKDLIKMNKLESHYAVLHTSRMKTLLLKLYSNYMKKLADLSKPEQLSEEILRDLLRTSQSENLRIKGTDTVIKLANPITDATTRTVATPGPSDMVANNEEFEHVDSERVMTKTREKPKTKIPRTIKPKPKASIEKSFGVKKTNNSSPIIPPTMTRGNSTQTVMPASESRLRLPNLVIQKPNVTVKIVPPNKTNSLTEDSEQIKPNNTKIQVKILPKHLINPKPEIPA